MGKKVMAPQGYLAFDKADSVVGRVFMAVNKGAYGPKPRGILQAPKSQGGKVYWLPGHSDLTRKLQTLPDGSVVKLTYLGTEFDAPASVSNAHQWDVEIFDDPSELKALDMKAGGITDPTRLLPAAGEPAAAGDDDDTPF